MNLVDALSLLPGDRIIAAGNARETQDWTIKYSGTVLSVSGNGRIVIRDDNGYRASFGYHMVRDYVKRRRTRLERGMLRKPFATAQAARQSNRPVHAVEMTLAERIRRDDRAAANGYSRALPNPKPKP